MKVSTAPLGFWIKANEDVVEGDKITILDEGNELPNKKFGGTQTVFEVKTKKGDRIMGFNKTTMNNLIAALGDETENWKGKEVKVFIEKARIDGEMKTIIYLAGINYVMDEETGRFYKNTSEGDIIGKQIFAQRPTGNVIHQK